MNVKGALKTTAILAVTLSIGACSSMREIEITDTTANPNWYQDCEQLNSERWSFWKSDFAYSCGMGESKFEQASESQAYNFATKGYVKSILGMVDSNTTVDIKGNNGIEIWWKHPLMGVVTQTIVRHSTRDDTSIREYVEVKKYAYEFGSTGRVHTYVRIKMPLEVFDKLLTKAKALKQLDM
jgi:hypothetical protein